MEFWKSLFCSFSWKQSKMKTKIVIDVSSPSFIGIVLVLELWVKMLSVNQMQAFLKCNISRNKQIMKFIFGMQVNIEVFYKFILSFWVCITRHAKSTQNKKFVYLWNVSRKAWGMKLIFCRKTQKFSASCKQQVYNISAISQIIHEG